MICPNADCINKSVVYRQYDAVKVQICKRCKTELIHERRLTASRLNRTAKAVKDLNDFGLNSDGTNK